MAKIETRTVGNKGLYPISLSLGMIIGAVLLSFVDLMFLNDVIGRVLNVGPTESMLIAAAVGLIGIFIMASQGFRRAHGDNNRFATAIHYAMWIVLGFVLAALRFFSATIMNVRAEDPDALLIPILGWDVAQADIVIAPLMLVMYFATGMLVMDGAKHLFSNPDLAKWREKLTLSKLKKKTLEEKRLAEAEEAQRIALAAAEKARNDAKLTAQERIAREKAARIYNQALKNYHEKLAEIKNHYQKISTNIDYVKTIDKQEHQFETSVKPNLMQVVRGSIEGVQNATALAIRAKNGGDMQDLQAQIETHNAKRS